MLSKYADADGVQISLCGIHGKADELVLLDYALQILLEMLSEMSKGNTVSLIPHHHEIGTLEAVNLLNVGRPYLVQLLVKVSYLFDWSVHTVAFGYASAKCCSIFASTTGTRNSSERSLGKRESLIFVMTSFCCSINFMRQLYELIKIKYFFNNASDGVRICLAYILFQFTPGIAESAPIDFISINGQD